MKEKFKKIRFTVEYLEDQSPLVETLWAKDLGNDKYELDNSPFYAYGVSYKDIVIAVPGMDGVLSKRW